MAAAKLAQLEARAEELARRRDELVATIDGSAAVELQLRVEALEKDPSKPTFAIGSPLEKHRRKVEETRKSLANVEADLMALSVVLQRERKIESDDRKAAIFAAAVHHDTAEREAIAALGDAVAGFLTAYGVYVDVLTSRRDTSLEGITDEASIAQIRERLQPVATPVPIDPAACFDIVFTAATDAYDGGVRDGGKWARSSNIVGGWVENTPDLRGQVRHAPLQLSKSRYAISRHAASGSETTTKPEGGLSNGFAGNPVTLPAGAY